MHSVLLLQGPLGRFFSRLASELKAEGHTVFKINFNGGDEVCYDHEGAYAFCDGLSAWSDYLQDFIQRHGVDRIFLFGDCRPYHRVALKVAQTLNVAVFVFEEGYLRPDYVTLERGGVNGNSQVARDAEFYASYSASRVRDPRPVPGGFRAVAFEAIRYYLGAWAKARKYPLYTHHRSLSVPGESLRWVVSGIKKRLYRIGDERLLRRLRGEWRGKYYLVPLQVHCDAQISHHSPYTYVEEFIADVIGSFAEHAPPDTLLIIKHHPLDRAYRNYRPLIDLLSARHMVRHRVRYLHEGHLPSLLRFARGTVTINSTVGLSSIHHRTPVKVMGEAIYDMPGLTSQVPLHEFWSDPGSVNRSLFLRFRKFLLENVLGHGSFYRPLRDDRGATGIAWPHGSISAMMEKVGNYQHDAAGVRHDGESWGQVVPWPKALGGRRHRQLEPPASGE